MYEAAGKLGITCTIMPDHQTILMQLDGQQWYSRGSRTSTQSAIGQTIASNKATAKQFLEAYQIPTAQSVFVTQSSELTKLSALQWPVVMKPAKGAHGRGVIVGIQSLSEAETAFNKLAEPALFEELLNGTEYRIVCVDYQFQAAAYRKAAYVVGDGEHTITELVALKNQDPNRQAGHKGKLSSIIIDDVVVANLAELNFTPTSVPAKNQEVQLRKTANLSTGGEAHTVTHLVCPENKALFEKIARIFDLSVIGIDIMCQSLETPIIDQPKAGVIEINKSPGLRMHHFPSVGAPIDLASIILSATIRHLKQVTEIAWLGTIPSWMHQATNIHQSRKIALGLSGGVDSAVAAHLLLQAGHDVTAVYIECWNEPGCRAEQDKQDALKVALQLGIPFKTLDFRTAYKTEVLSYFLHEYRVGRTPNPDVLCNKIIKFGLFYDWAIRNGFDAIATGHYAQISELPNSIQAVTRAAKLQLSIGVDAHKDQTYFLNLLKAEQLKHILFPLAQFTKETVRTIASSLNLPVAQKKDSTGICFIGEINVSAYLKEQLGEKLGPICDEAGQQIGTHRGIWFYTIGQRQGITVNARLVKKYNPSLVDSENQLKPLYVIARNSATNTLTVGTKQQIEQNIIKTEPPHWIDTVLAQHLLADQSARLMVRIRHTGELLPITIEQQSDSTLTLRLSHPVAGVASGQSAVIYAKLEGLSSIVCLGGAQISI